MIFWRILDNKLYSVNETDNLGFEKSDGFGIPDEYLENQEFVILRTSHGFGDWGIISAMPRLLKQKYPNCKVYLPSPKLLENLFDGVVNTKHWQSWNNPFLNVKNVFKNNPYIDGYKDSVDGDIYHDHYRIYDNELINTPLIQQMLKFWQFKEKDYQDCQPELYFTDDEKKLGDNIIEEYMGKSEFGCLLISDRFGTLMGKPNEESLKRETKEITKFLQSNDLPYFYWSYKPINNTPFNFINTVLDMRNIDLRVQLYIKSKAKLNIGNQCGPMDIIPRYSDTYIVQRQFPLGMNFIKGVNYL